MLPLLQLIMLHGTPSSWAQLVRHSEMKLHFLGSHLETDFQSKLFHSSTS